MSEIQKVLNLHTIHKLLYEKNKDSGYQRNNNNNNI